MSSFEIDGFNKRFSDLISSKPVSWWAKELSVSVSTIRSRWLKGSQPKASSVAKMCAIANISPTWLLLGIGPKELDKCNMMHDKDISDALAQFRENLPDRLKNNPIFNKTFQLQALVAQIIELIGDDEGPARDILIASLKIAMESFSQK